LTWCTEAKFEEHIEALAMVPAANHLFEEPGHHEGSRTSGRIDADTWARHSDHLRQLFSYIRFAANAEAEKVFLPGVHLFGAKRLAAASRVSCCRAVIIDDIHR
jgi:hypothetical protein